MNHFLVIRLRAAELCKLAILPICEASRRSLRRHREKGALLEAPEYRTGHEALLSFYNALHRAHRQSASTTRIVLTPISSLASARSANASLRTAMSSGRNFCRNQRAFTVANQIPPAHFNKYLA